MIPGAISIVSKFYVFLSTFIKYYLFKLDLLFYVELQLLSYWFLWFSCVMCYLIMGRKENSIALIVSAIQLKDFACGLPWKVVYLLRDLWVEQTKVGLEDFYAETGLYRSVYMLNIYKWRF